MVKHSRVPDTSPSGGGGRRRAGNFHVTGFVREVVEGLLKLRPRLRAKIMAEFFRVVRGAGRKPPIKTTLNLWINWEIAFLAFVIL